METYKPERKNLSLGTTVSPMSNYIGKAPALQSGVGDGLLRLAKNLESYNPALKTLAEEHEKDLMEKGYAEAMKFAEETGELKEHQTLWNEFQAKNPEMTSFNPYLKRFLDGKTVESLTLERDNFMKLAYVQKGWAGLDSEAYRKAVEEENAAWHKANQGLLNSLDSREVASKFDKATQGMYASLNTEHIKAESERVIKRRAAALQNDTSFFIKDNLREITDGFNSNKVDIFHLSSQTEANNAALAGIVRNSNLMRNLNELLGNYENQGMTREEGVQTILATLKNHAVNNPDDADEMIIFGKEFAKDSPTISKEAMETWGRETEIAAIAEANRQDKIGFQQDDNEQKQLGIDVRNAINTLTPAQTEGKTGQELMAILKRPDGSAFPQASISLFNTHATAINEGSKTIETEQQIEARNDIEYLIRTSNTITRKYVYGAVTSGVVHSSRLNFLLNQLDDKEKDGGVVMQRKELRRKDAYDLVKALVGKTEGADDVAKIYAVNRYRREFDEVEVGLKREMTTNEMEDHVLKTFPNYAKTPAFKTQDTVPYDDWKNRNVELLLDDPTLGDFLMRNEDKDGNVTSIKTVEELVQDMRSYKEHPEILRKKIEEKYNTFVPDEQLALVFETFKKPVITALQKKLKSYPTEFQNKIQALLLDIFEGAVQTTRIPITLRDTVNKNLNSLFEAEGDTSLNHSKP